MVRCDDHHRLNWPTAKVLHVLPDSTGVTRTVEVLAEGAKMICPLAHLVPLEVHSDDRSDFIDILPDLDLDCLTTAPPPDSEPALEVNPEDEAEVPEGAEESVVRIEGAPELPAATTQQLCRTHQKCEDLLRCL